MLNNEPFFYFNHLILFFIWAFFHVYFLNHEETNIRMFIKLYLGLMLNMAINFLIGFIFDELFSVNLIRTLFSILTLFITLKIVVKDIWANTFFAVIFHTLCIVFSEMLTILVMLALSGFDQQSFQDASFFGTLGFIIMDVFNALFLWGVWGLKKRALRNIDWKKQGRVIPIIIVQGAWIYLLSYKLIYAYKISVSLIPILIFSWLLMQGSVVMLIHSLITLKKDREKAENEHLYNAQLQNQITELYQKQNIMDDLWKNVQNQVEHLNLNEIYQLHQQIGEIRYALYCDNPSVNAMLASFIRQCQEKNISCTYSIQATLLNGIDDYDLNTLLANLLKNAVEATEGNLHPQIELTIKQRNQILLIRCTNNLGQKKKRQKKIHGNGKLIITQIVKKYQGEVQWHLDTQQAVTEIFINKMIID